MRLTQDSLLIVCLANNIHVKDVPSGKWKHDKFSEVYGSDDGDSFTEGRSFGGGGSGFSRRRSGGNRSSIVKLNISNLPDSVITADLEV